MYIWTPVSVGFRTDAERFCHIGEQIADAVIPHLTADARICDAGCGLGYLALHLAKKNYQVTAVDTDPAALSILREEAVSCPEADTHLTILQEDLFEMHPKEFFTDMIFSFFGSLDEVLTIARQSCIGNIYLIRKTWKQPRFSLSAADGSSLSVSGNDLQESLPESTFTQEALRQEIERLQIPKQEVFFEAEMGQPFRSLEDAAAYFTIYGHTDDMLTPDDVRPHLEETGDPVFPWFFSSRKELGMLILRMDDIRRNL